MNSPEIIPATDLAGPESYLEPLSAFEVSVSNLDVGDSDSLSKVRDNFQRAIENTCKNESLSWNSYTKLADSAQSLPREIGREIALLIIRSLNIEGLIPSKKEEPQIEVSIVSMTLKLLPDISKKFGIDAKKQTYENFDAICAIHQQVIDSFKPWSNLPQSIEGIIANKNDIYKGANKPYVKTYLRHYDLSSIMSSLNEIFTFLKIIIAEDNEDFFDPLEKLQEIIEAQEEYINENYSFITRYFYKELLSSVGNALKLIEEESSEKFQCDLKPKNSGLYLAAKKYPLHETGREIIIRIPMINSGPGIAKDVSVEYFDTDTPSLTLACFHDLGNIRSGPFELAVNALVIDESQESEFQFVVSWRQQGNTKKEENIFQCKVEAQRPDIDWESLKYEEPYSTEIAEGPEFVGRTNKLNVLVKRALKSRMQSSYISGQKRIGKTSLAIAVTDHINEEHSDKDISTHYIEWGEVARSDSSQSVKALGENVACFLREHLPVECKLPELDFNGSISPLNELANLLLKVKPTKKFLIILDEFDEIHPEMYRYGRLAEAFFANLRTLSSKKNMAFMLVGGENMPFVISAQGDQLNRFVFETLDYFSKESEENDYNQLVIKPTEKYLSWSSDAIRELFYLTNGHPFYTKLICSEVFSAAASERDSEICNREISSATNKLIEKLDINSFAHHWRDGIQKTEEEAETIVLNRCRCLVAIGRTIREGSEVTFDNICSTNRSTHLSALDIKAILSDFVRRGILNESLNKYEFCVPFFQKWLVNRGIGILIADTIGDDIAEAKHKEDEIIRVRSAEIESLVESWQPYRGQDITTEKIRFWLEQAGSIKEQRLLFKLLLNLRFLNEIEIRDKLKTAHELAKASLPIVVQTKKRQLRKDVIVSYIDGEAKSGQYFASRYAEENSIPSGNVIPSERFSVDVERFETSENITINGVVLVDDIVATGKSISGNLDKFLTDNYQFISDRSLAVIIVVLVSTAEGEKAINKTIKKFENIDVQYRVCETLAPKHFAFSESSKIWSSETEFDQAKALCNKIGSFVQKKQPLGYGGQGLLVVFPDRCPNNTIPLLHGSSNGEIKWKPLFPRPKN